MIYLVKEKNYQGIDHRVLSEEIIKILEAKGAKTKIPYSEPSNYGETAKWSELNDEVKYAKYYQYDLGNGILLKEQEYIQVFKYVEVLSILDQDTIKHEVNIDLNELSDKIMNKVINNAKHLFNSKLEVHQPNMPLFQYNQYQVIVDECTEDLQNNYIDKGWRVVCICPQPDQRRPDYIVAKYEKENM